MRGRAPGAALRFLPPVNAPVQEQIILFVELHAAAFHIIFRRSLCLHGVDLIFPFVHTEECNDKADTKRNKSC